MTHAEEMHVEVRPQAATNKWCSYRQRELQTELHNLENAI